MPFSKPAVRVTLNNNGQAIQLRKKLADKGAADVAWLAKLMAAASSRCGHVRGGSRMVCSRKYIAELPPPTPAQLTSSADATA